VEPGSVTVTLYGPTGPEPPRTVSVAAGETVRMDLASVRPVVEEKPAGPDRATGLPPRSAGVDPKLVTGGVLLALGAVGGGVAIGLWKRAVDLRDEYCPDYATLDNCPTERLDLRSSAETYETATNVVIVSSAVVAAAGGVFIALGLGGDGGSTAVVTVRPGGVALAGRFR
jgi:hypothetical protein